MPLRNLKLHGVMDLKTLNYSCPASDLKMVLHTRGHSETLDAAVERTNKFCQKLKGLIEDKGLLVGQIYSDESGLF